MKNSSLVLGCLFGILAVLAAVEAKEFRHRLRGQTEPLAAKTDAESTTPLRVGGRQGLQGGGNGQKRRNPYYDADLDAFGGDAFGGGSGMPVAGSIYNGRTSVLGSFSPFGNLGGEFNGWRDNGALKWGNTYRTLFGIGDFDDYGPGGIGGNRGGRGGNRGGQGGRGSQRRRQDGDNDNDGGRRGRKERKYHDNDGDWNGNHKGDWKGNHKGDWNDNEESEWNPEWQ